MIGMLGAAPLQYQTKGSRVWLTDGSCVGTLGGEDAVLKDGVIMQVLRSRNHSVVASKNVFGESSLGR